MKSSKSSHRVAKLLNQAISFHQRGELQSAHDLYRQALTLDPRNFGALHCLGLLYGQVGRFEEALNLFTQACAVQPGEFSAHYNRGKALQELHRNEEALASYNKTLALNPHYPEGYNNRGIVLNSLRRYDEALASYDAALSLRDDYVEAHLNRGNVLVELQRYEEALASYDKALSFDGNLAEGHCHRGLVLRALWRTEESLASCDRAIALRPDYAEAYKNRGDLLKELKRYEEALASYNRSIALDPEQFYIHGSRLYSQLASGDWSDLDQRTAEICNRIDAGKLAAAPFDLMAVAVPAMTLRKAAELSAAVDCPAAPHALWNGERYSHQRIRIGYFSADFHNHATAHLMAELFEKHDRSRFEIFAFSFGPAIQDAMRIRLVKAFDHFFEMKEQSSRSIAELARANEIDIAVDLKGYTQDCRPAIFALRPAPVQVNYLGFPGTMSVPYIDYIIADPVIIPKDHFEFYSEKVVHLPNSYQVNDSQRRIAESTPSRRELGLPERGFVFCCFNNNSKITPDLFTIWMRLLTQVEGSVLWLLKGSESICRNLRGEAQKRGVAPERLIFAPHMELAEHLARHRQADLFLDTFYYNAHTTTSDALWAGLPVVTSLGNTFAGRVAASLLRAVGLPELITHTHEEYEALALKLATQPDELARLKKSLAGNRLTQPLFDSSLFTKQIESAYAEMWRRHQQGLAPDHFAVSE